nr:FIST C-terminal domain-containing protein [uncultured Flavobacterium sp.]
MKIQQVLINESSRIHIAKTSTSFNADSAQLVIAFGEREMLESLDFYKILKQQYSNADIVICSSAGQVSNDIGGEINLVATAIEFEKTEFRILNYNLLEKQNLDQLSPQIIREIVSDDLNSLMVLSEGTYGNGTELITELTKATESKIPIFGGMAGDALNFRKTIVGVNENPKEGEIALIAFYGNNIKFGFGCEGGWTDFGPEREVTLSDKNVLYKIGDDYALDLYKEYLGKYADDLPGSALYFPLSMRENEYASPVVRTILSIDEQEKSMTFAGNIPQGATVKLMKGNFDKLIDASYNASNASIANGYSNPELVMIVSCVGRKVVLENRIEEEIEIVKEVFGNNTFLFGFYSYGEISPVVRHKPCELHNQTISITSIHEL